MNSENPFIPKTNKLCTKPLGRFTRLVRDVVKKGIMITEIVNHATNDMDKILISQQALKQIMKAKHKSTPYVLFYVISKLQKDEDIVSINMDKMCNAIAHYKKSALYDGLRELEAMNFIARSNRVTMKKRVYYINPEKLFKGKLYEFLVSTGVTGIVDVTHTVKVD